ncbi:MAG: hypothetical protein AAGN46_00685 [Acidobacteriota bacterium]
MATRPTPSRRPSDRRRYQRIDVEEPRRGPQSLVLLLSLLGIAIALFMIFREAPADGDGASFDTVPAPNLTPIGAEAELLPTLPLRSEITALERSLADVPAEDPWRDVADRIAAEAERLARAVADLDHRRSASVAESIRRYAAEARTASDFRTLGVLRDRWQALRDSHFQPFAGFRDLGGSTERASATAAAYRSGASELVAMLETARSQARSLTEADPLDPQDLDRRRRAWSEYLVSWRADLTALRGRLPNRPDAEADPDLLMATQRLENALGAAARLAADERLIFAADLEARFDGPLALAEEAITDLQRPR